MHNVLDGEWISEELGRFFWLTPEDMLQVKTCRGAANRLGFALNLLLMRLLHCPFKEQAHHVTHGKTLTQHVHTLRKIAKVVLDPAVPDDQVRPQIFAVVPQPQL